MTTEELNKLSREATLRVFPYTDEGNLEDDIDAAKRNIYQHGFIEGMTVAKNISFNLPVIGSLPSDREIEDAHSKMINISKSVGFVNGAKWMRALAGQ